MSRQVTKVIKSGKFLFSSFRIFSHMDVNSPLSFRANAFSIQSLMSGSLTDLTLGGFGYSVVPPQRSTDCCFDWGQNGAYGPGMKTMEGMTSDYGDIDFFLWKFYYWWFFFWNGAL